ncbi:MAG: hypothetical protein QMD01_05725 [Thermodesulfovibrionales bacterium]|nr:hypothetical protein [Thermodesulfovibrionales bacterium]
MQREYGYVGYTLYIMLFGGAVTGMGTGALMPFRKVGSLCQILPLIQKRLSIASLIFYLIFFVMVTHEIITSSLIMER